MGGLFIFISLASHLYGLNGIKSKTVGNGQHGTARWASRGEIDKTYTKVNYEPQKWRTDEKSRPKAQGIVVGCETVGKKQTIGLVDTGDVHCMMIGAAGVGVLVVSQYRIRLRLGYVFHVNRYQGRHHEKLRFHCVEILRI